MNISTNKTTLFACTFLSGVLAKIYDDLTDNYRLHKFSNPMRIEIVKNMFFVTFTFTSIFSPLWYVIMWVWNFLLMLCEPLSYELTFERSLYITSGLVFLFINYDKLFEQMNELFSSLYYARSFFLFVIITIVFETILRKIILLPGVPQWVRTHCNIEKEVSVFKLVESVYAIVSLSIMFYCINNIVSKLFMIWMTGYACIRICSQVYSLFVYKPKSFPLDKNPDKQTPSKEPLSKEEPEELKEENAPS